MMLAKLNLLTIIINFTTEFYDQCNRKKNLVNSKQKLYLFHTI